MKIKVKPKGSSRPSEPRSTHGSKRKTEEVHEQLEEDEDDDKREQKNHQERGR